MGRPWALWLVIACAACEGVGTALPWSTDFTIPPGGFVEANLAMDAGMVARAHYDARGGRLDWNVHGHQADGGLFAYEAGEGTSGDVPFRAPRSGRFSFYWQNAGDVEVRLAVTVSGQGTLLSTSRGP